MNSKQWFRKLFVILITILTFGLVTPSYALENSYEENKSLKRNIPEQSSETMDRLSIDSLRFPSFDVPRITEKDYFLAQVFQKAEEQSWQKFGSKIKPVIETEFRELILPKIETAIMEITAQFPEEHLNRLQVTEMPGGGNSEMIFNIVDKNSNEDIIQFHVRKDHPPQQGFWFNFHYHTWKDHYQTHHDLGLIYWDKNTPPSWLN